MDNVSFYHELPAHVGALADLLSGSAPFCAVPETWHVIVTDIQGSTKATAAGRARDINTIAASCLIACLNIAKKQQIDIPFFYGGDGATLIVPPTMLREMLSALVVLKKNTLQAYDLPLRVGSLPVADVYAAHKTLLLAKWLVTPGYHQAICLGDGLAYADTCIKRREQEVPGEDVVAETPLDLFGLACRWDEIHPQAPASEVVCLMVQAPSNQQAEVYARVLNILDRVYGDDAMRHPVKREQLTSSVKRSDARRKSSLLFGYERMWFTFFERFRMYRDAWLFKNHWTIGAFDPDKYLRELTAAVDTLHLSGTLFTMVSGTQAERLALRAELDALENDGRLIYGLATCPASVMTCYVQNHQTRHMHFLDGAGGGYTQASKEFKQKINVKEAVL